MSSSTASPHRKSVPERVAAVRDQVAIEAVVGAVVKLGKGNHPRGKCPFHDNKSDSFTVYPDGGRAKCWGCQWSGDAIEFVRDHYGLSFMEALERLERNHGLDGLAAAPVKREKRATQRRERESVDSIVFGRRLWKLSVPDLDAVRTYLRARGVPEGMLGAERLADIRFVPLGPIAAWQEGADWRKVPQAPVMVALMRRPGTWAPAGVHATFLSPSLTAKMKRQRRDGSDYPARKMLGPAGGACVLLPGSGGFVPDCPLYDGEGIETVLSGMAIDGADSAASGLAVLSLNNLQGSPRMVRGALPLYDVQPDFEAQHQAIAFEHRGPVTCLIDADMAPLNGFRRRGSDELVPPLVIEQRRERPIRRPITGAERAEICAALSTRAWRAKGCRATAIRARMGQDFNDMVRSGA